MLQTHTFKIIWSQTKHAPDTAPTTTQQSKPRAANPRVLQRTERLLEEGPAAVGVALKNRTPNFRAARFHLLLEFCVRPHVNFGSATEHRPTEECSHVRPPRRRSPDWHCPTMVWHRASWPKVGQQTCGLANTSDESGQ